MRLTIVLVLLITGFFDHSYGQKISSTNKKEDTTMLLSEIISSNPQAPVLVIFGGNPHRRHEVLTMLKPLGDITMYGTLSEAEGLMKLQALPRVDLVLIGGRYDASQRKRIKSFVEKELPNTRVTQPGYDYPYENEVIQRDIKTKLGL